MLESWKAIQMFEWTVRKGKILVYRSVRLQRDRDKRRWICLLYKEIWNLIQFRLCEMWRWDLSTRYLWPHIEAVGNVLPCLHRLPPKLSLPMLNRSMRLTIKWLSPVQQSLFVLERPVHVQKYGMCLGPSLMQCRLKLSARALVASWIESVEEDSLWCSFQSNLTDHYDWDTLRFHTISNRLTSSSLRFI